MDLHKQLTEDEILVESPLLSEPIVVCIKRPNVIESMRISDAAAALGEPENTDLRLRALAGCVRPFIVDVKERDGSPVTFGSTPWKLLDEDRATDELISFYGVLVTPLLRELVGAVLGKESTGKSLRRSERAS